MGTHHKAARMPVYLAGADPRAAHSERPRPTGTRCVGVADVKVPQGAQRSKRQACDGYRLLRAAFAHRV